MRISSAARAADSILTEKPEAIMLYLLFSDSAAKWIAFFGLVLAFLLTCILLRALQNILPREEAARFP